MMIAPSATPAVIVNMRVLGIFIRLCEIWRGKAKIFLVNQLSFVQLRRKLSLQITIYIIIFVFVKSDFKTYIRHSSLL